MTLRAAVQAVKVVNFPPTPKPDAAALKAAWDAVNAAWLGDKIAIWGVAVALATLVVSAIVAWRTLVQIKEQIKLGEESNAFVREDLDYSRKQVEHISRRAKLELWHNRQRIPFIVNVSDQDEKEIEITLWVFNEGENTARDCTLFLWLPSQWRVPGWNGISNPKPYFANQGLNVIANVPLDGKRYWHVAVDVPFPTYPKMPRIGKTFTVVMPVGFEGDLLWRIGYDDGLAPPETAPEGRLRFELCGPNKYETMPPELQDSSYSY